MRDIPLQDIIAALTDSTQLEELISGALPLVRFLLLRGAGPVTPERLATALRLSRAELEALLPPSMLVVGPDGYVHLAPGAHQFYLDGDGETLFGWCALDTLFYPLLIGQAAHVVSTCPATGSPIRLTVTEQGVRDLDPKAAVVSLLVPNETTNACNVRETICAYGHFFFDQEHAATWPDLHPEAVLLSVEDAAYLVREMTAASRAGLENKVLEAALLDRLHPRDGQRVVK